MTISELKVFAASFNKYNDSNSLLKRRAAYDIINKLDSITDYISDEDRINQSASFYYNLWQNLYNITKLNKFKTFMSVATYVKAPMLNFNEVETILRDSKFDTFEELLSFIKKSSWSNRVEFNTLKSVFDIMELNNNDN